MKDYFAQRAEAPTREPNKYLVELFRNISGGEEDIKDTWRRLGWVPKEERKVITPPTPTVEPVRPWKNREINDYAGLTKEQQKMKYEDDLQHANPEYGDEGTGYEASQVTPPWEWAYYNEQPTPEREARPQAPGGTLAKMKKHFESGKMPFLGQSNSNWRIG